MAVIATSGFKVGNTVEFITNKLPAATGNYFAGDLLEKDTTTGNLKICTTAANFCAIVTEDLVVTTPGSKMAVFLTGMFDLEKLNGSSAFDEATLRHAGRTYNIFFAETK